VLQFSIVFSGKIVAKVEPGDLALQRFASYGLISQ
jgi:hypothetical protein